MSVIWYKLWADLWHNKIRTMLVVVSIATSIFAIGATFGMADQMLARMDRDHQAGNPPHIKMFLTENIDRDLVDRLRKVEGVEDIDLAGQATIRYKIRPEDDWQSAWVIMLADYDEQKYELLPLKAGTWPKGNSIGLERLSGQDFNLGLGDTVYVEIDDRLKPRQISGIIRYGFVGPPSFGAPTVFFSDASGMEAFGLPAGRYNQIMVRIAPYDESLAHRVASDIKNRLSKEGIGVASTVYQDPNRHWGRSILAGINMVLEIMAAACLAASVVLVFNTLMAVIAQQTAQIGVLKAIGGTRARIMKLYLAGVLVYGLLSLLLALPLGAYLAYTLSKFFLNMLNIDHEQFYYSPKALALQTVAALAVPLLAALWPILRGANLTVREALATYGLGSDFGHSRLDRLVERLGRRCLSAPYAIALGHTFQRKGRLLWTQAVLVLAGVMFLGVTSLASSLDQTMDDSFARSNYDFVLNFADSERIERVVGLARSHSEVDYAEVWFSHGASLLKAGQRLKEAGLGAELVGLPGDSDTFSPDRIVGGRWLSSNDGQVIVISQDTARHNGIQVGDTVTLDLGELGDDEWQVAGVYVNTISDFGREIDPIYAPIEAVARATHRYNQGNALYVRTGRPDPAGVRAVAAELEAACEARGLDVTGFKTRLDMREEAGSQLGLVVSMLLLLAVIMALVGGIGLMGALAIGVVERTREIGVMRAIGAKTGTILGMFIVEGVIQGVMSWLIAVPLSLVAGRPMADGLGAILFEASLTYRYNTGAVLLWLAIILVIASLASVLPARRAAIISVRDSLAYA